MTPRLTMIRTTVCALTALVGSAAAAPGKPAMAPPAKPAMAPLDQYLIADRAAEVKLARSAAPPSIADQATVMVLTPRGYEVAAEGSNGFVCLVDRAWQSPYDDDNFWNPKIRSPICFNPPAVRSVLPVEHRQTALALNKLSTAEILARMKAAIASKQVGPPEAGAMSYMMSKDMYLNDRDVHWHPHVMFYLPGSLDGSALGANAAGSPVIGGPEELPGGGRLPVATYIVPVHRWSDGTEVAFTKH